MSALPRSRAFIQQCKYFMRIVTLDEQGEEIPSAFEEWYRRRYWPSRQNLEAHWDAQWREVYSVEDSARVAKHLGIDVEAEYRTQQHNANSSIGMIAIRLHGVEGISEEAVRQYFANQPGFIIEQTTDPSGASDP